jgi:hypothetical protein
VLWDVLGYDLMDEENVLWRDNEKLVSREAFIYNCISCVRVARQK